MECGGFFVFSEAKGCPFAGEATKKQRRLDKGQVLPVPCPTASVFNRKLLLMHQFDDMAELFEAGSSEGIKVDNQVAGSHVGKGSQLASDLFI